MSVYRRILQYYRPYAWQTCFALLISLITIALSLLKPWPFKIIVDEILPKGGYLTQAAASAASREDGLSQHVDSGITALITRIAPAHAHDPKFFVLCLCVGLVFIHLVSGLLGLWGNFLFIRVGLQALLKLRTDLFAYLQALPLKFHDARRSADSSFRVAYDSQSIQTVYNRGFTNIFSSVSTLLGILVIMINLDPFLTLLSLAIVPVVVWAIQYYASRIRRESTTIQEKESAVLALVQEGLTSIKVVHAFGQEEATVNQFRMHAQQSLAANLKLTMTNVRSALVVNTLMAIGAAALTYWGTLHVINGELSLGTLTVFLSYLAMLYAPIESLTQIVWALAGATAGAQRCFEVLDHADDVKDIPDARRITHANGHIVFKDVQFGYSHERAILKDINLEILPGEKVAVVGGTGAGKSTLLSLVPRFYDPTLGQVMLDGNDVKTLTKKSLRSQMSLVLQDTLLFSTSIRENIAYGRPDATEEEIVEAARRAQADDFIRAMPGGYDAFAGERGGYLSVGQRQRIGIARAFLKNSPILLLDEPTSALDPATERAIMDTLLELMKGRTTLIITHRLATVHSLDKIVVLQAGEIVEVGSGTRLLEKENGVYSRLYRAGNF